MSEKKLLELVGTVEHIVFKNDSNSYTVMEVMVKEQLVTAVGIIPLINEGEDIRLFGNWKSHPNFGLQFSFEAYERTMPSTSQSIFKYLSSGAIKGVGKIIAMRLVEEFGDDTLRIMKEEPEKLTQVRGITKSKAHKIAEEVHNVFGIREIMLYMNKYGVKPQEALKIWKVWGTQSIDNIKNNPYLICDEPININFDVADLIAEENQMPSDNICRVRAAFIHILKHNMNNGHTCLPSDKLVLAAASFLNIDNNYAQDTLNSLKEEHILESDIIDEVEFIFTPQMHRTEIYCAARLNMMLNYPPQSIVGVDEEISSIEKAENMEYAMMQKKAIKSALDNGLLILTGGPGTGKTTTLNAIIRILKRKGGKVLLAAPTGRAAKRMSEITNEDAKTIHRLLEVKWDNENRSFFNKNEKNLLECDALILDELSMVDISLFEGALRALPLGCRLIMVGDPDQLPSVGAGNVLGDLISSNIIPKVQLTEIFRQSMKSLIVTNAHKIVRGEQPNLLIKNNDFFFLDRLDLVSSRETIIELCSKRLPKSYNYSSLYDIQVLCPSRKGELGTIELNKHLQNALNPSIIDKKEISYVGGVLRQGDKVMQNKNNYTIPWYGMDGTSGEGVYNGDIGILKDIDKHQSIVTVQYDDKLAVYDMENIVDLELAYAITIHKSQGSEFEAVIMPMIGIVPQLSYRNLLYTGVTRAKSIIIMVGKKNYVYKMVNNDSKTKRYSSLYNFLLR